ncbi:hypothetical protein ABZ754_01135 [Micromonospora purpureochromogenes]
MTTAKNVVLVRVGFVDGPDLQKGLAAARRRDPDPPTPAAGMR